MSCPQSFLLGSKSHNDCPTFLCPFYSTFENRWNLTISRDASKKSNEKEEQKEQNNVKDILKNIPQFSLYKDPWETFIPNIRYLEKSIILPNN